VVVDGQDTSVLSERALTDLRLHRIGFIFQTNLVPVLTVFQTWVPAPAAGGLGRASGNGG
jgi:ABC-type lipoprotein export system ATPase subunit